MSHGNSDIRPCSWKFSERVQTVKKLREVGEVEEVVVAAALQF